MPREDSRNWLACWDSGCLRLPGRDRRSTATGAVTPFRRLPCRASRGVQAARFVASVRPACDPRLGSWGDIDRHLEADRRAVWIRVEFEANGHALNDRRAAASVRRCTRRGHESPVVAHGDHEPALFLFDQDRHCTVRLIPVCMLDGIRARLVSGENCGLLG